MKYQNIPVIIATGINTIETAVMCMKNGAYDYMIKPVEINRLITNINHCLEKIELENEIDILSRKIEINNLENPGIFSEIITNNERMFSIFKKIEAIAKNLKPILITGDSGTGKELFARAIHKASVQKGEFVSVNAAGLDDTTFTDTLFGHKKGAYTGAVNDRMGLVKKAEGGTLFLDEIGDLENESQVKLLRLLQEGEYYSLGSDEIQKSNAMIIAATNANLIEKQKKGTFRKDLAFRFSHTIKVPPLNYRLDDIPFLLEHFLKKSAKTMSKKKPTAPNELEILLKTYHYSGNIREFEHMVEEAVTRHKSKKISLSYFKEYIKEHSIFKNNNFNSAHNPENIINLSEPFPTLCDVEKLLIIKALEKSKGNKTIASGILGISNYALSRRLKKYKLE